MSEAYQAGVQAGFWRWWYLPLVFLDLPSKDKTIRQAYRRGIRDGIKKRARSKRLVAQLASGKMSRAYFRAHRDEVLHAVTVEASKVPTPLPADLLREAGFDPKEPE